MGGMKVVVRGIDPDDQKTVAIAFLDYPQPSPEERLRLIQEGEVLEALKGHLHIVQLYQFGYAEIYPGQGSQPFLVMELLEGGTLGDRVTDGPCDVKEIFEVMPPICDAIGYAHRRQILHRDIKPENILFTADGIPKVADFGLAKVANANLTATRQRLGTPFYVSPEQGEVDAKRVTLATDIYSLGALLLELTLGRPLMVEQVYQQLGKSSLGESLQRLQITSGHDPIRSGLLTIAERCLQRLPSERFANTDQLVSALRNLERDQSLLQTESRPRDTKSASQLLVTDGNEGRQAAYSSQASLSLRWISVIMLLIGLIAVAIWYFSPLDRSAALFHTNSIPQTLDQISKLLDERRYEEAERMLTTIVEDGTVEPAVLALRGRVRLLQHQTEDAIGDFEQAIEAQPDEFAAWLGLAQAHRQRRRFRESLVAFDRADEIRPKDPQVLSGRGSVHRSLQQHNLAIKDYSNALLALPKDAELFEARGWAYLSLKQFEESIRDFQHAVALDQGRTHLHREIQQILETQRPTPLTSSNSATRNHHTD
jgi:serine/threonine protein kinase